MLSNVLKEVLRCYNYAVVMGKIDLESHKIY